jgi:hypothetical protein
MREQHTLQANAENAPPALPSILLLAFVGCVLFVTVVSLFRNYWSVVDRFGDNYSYVAIATAIRHWNFEGLEVKHFWGLPYLMAMTSFWTGASPRSALLVISFGTCFVTIILVNKLWGGWIASFFVVLNFDWLQRSFLGGAEPLFLCLLFATFLAVRKDSWLWAALLASLSTLVRPMGLIALIAIGLTLLRLREFRTFIVVTLIALILGGLYVIPLAIYFGKPLANVTSYHQSDWDQGFFIDWPFHAIIKGTILYPAPWTNLLLTYGWIILFPLAAAVMLTARRYRQFVQNYPVETLFAAIYVTFLYTYNSPYWARVSFPRFALPIVPFALMVLKPWIPKNLPVLWTFGIISPILAAASALGIRNVLQLIYP